MSRVEDVRYIDRGAYSAATTYTYGDSVTSDGVRYVYTAAIPAVGAPLTTASWVARDKPGSLKAPTWAANTAYSTGDIITYAGNLYRVAVAHTSNSVVRPDYQFINTAPAVTLLNVNITTAQSTVSASEVPSGTYRRYVISTPPSATALPAFNLSASRHSYYSFVPGQRVLLRAWVRSTVATEATAAFGTTNANATAVANAQIFAVTAPTPVPANTWTQVSGLITVPPAMATASLSGMQVYFPAGTFASGGTVDLSSYEFIPVPATFAASQISSVPSIGAWFGTATPTAPFGYRLDWYTPATSISNSGPIRTAPDRTLQVLRQPNGWEARTYLPGELVTAFDGSLWEAVGLADTSEAPIRANLVRDPRLVNGIADWNPGLETSGGTVALSAATDTSGNNVLRWTRTAPATSATSTIFQIASYTFPADSDYFAVAFRLNATVSTTSNSSVTMQLLLEPMDQNGTVIVTSSSSMTVFTGTTNTAMSANVGILSANYPTLGLAPSYRLTVRAVVGTYGDQLSGTMDLRELCISPLPANVSFPTPYFTGSDTTNLPPSYTAAWRGTPNASRSVAVSSKWRFIQAGQRNGRVPVAVSFLPGDVEYHYNAGERTMGGV